MSLLKNAIDSIETGVEDYLHGSERRKVSAIRNVYAGVLLLFKEKLRRLSLTADYPEILIYSRIKPSLDEFGKVIFEPKSKSSTVSADDIKSLFKELKIGYDKDTFYKLQVLRNQIEHHYSSESPKVIEESLSKSFLLIRNFIREQLNEEPVDLLSDSCWQTLIDLQHVHDAELNECLESRKKVDFKYKELIEYISELACQRYGSELVKSKA